MKIFKDNHIIEVSPDAYKTMYKRLGYEIVKTETKKVKEENITAKKDIVTKKEIVKKTQKNK